MEQQRLNHKPLVSSPIDIYRLELELATHPNRNFVYNLLSMLKEGARIGYTGPRSDRVSPNLISAAQHPEVVSLNLQKEIALGRVAGPYPSPPLPKFQCHSVGVIPKKHSTEWRTIYHLSFPQGTSINDHIPKDPYSLSYVRVDDAIRILQSLGRGAFMAKTDLKSAFFSLQMERALLFSRVYSYPCSKSRAIHRRCGVYRLWGILPGQVVSGPLAPEHAVEPTTGN